MKRFLATLERLTDSVSLFAANMAAMILLFLVFITCVDVIGRYFFGSPLTGTVELVEICMGAITFFSFPLMFMRHDHIIVDLIPHFKRGYLGWITSIIILAITFYVAIRLGDRVYDYAVRAYEDGDVTEYLNIPRYPVVGFITAMIFTAAVISMFKLLVLLTKPGHSVEEALEQNVVGSAGVSGVAFQGTVDHDATLPDTNESGAGEDGAGEDGASEDVNKR